MSSAYKKGDVVFVKSGSDEEPSYIAQIVSPPSSSGSCLLRWLYRPEDAKGGRQSWHGEKELFKQHSTKGMLLVDKNHVDR